MRSQGISDDLDWSAFCYAAGELSPDEVAAFEARLADDQAAREALARAVELTDVVASAESLAPVVVARSQSNAWTKRLAWMAIGSAASLLVALLSSGVWSWFGSEQTSSIQRSELASAWTQTRQELSESDSDLWYPKHLAADDAIPGESPGAEDDGELLDMVTPEWMTAAVESYPNEPADPDSTPFDGERSEN
jgi:hypothetical protein